MFFFGVIDEPLLFRESKKKYFFKLGKCEKEVNRLPLIGRGGSGTGRFCITSYGNFRLCEQKNPSTGFNSKTLNKNN